MRRLFLLATILLAACATPPADRADAYAEAPPGEAPPPSSLTGTWQVLLLDGDDKPGKGLAAEADAGRIWLTPACAGQALTYRISGNRIAMSPVVPGAVCRIGMPPATEATMAALAGVDTVESAPAGAIRMHGGGMVLLLVPRAAAGG